MSNPVRRGKERYRNVRPGPEGPRLFFHIRVSLLISLVSTFFIEIFGSKSLVVKNISSFNGFAGTSFALLFTVLAIILAFEEQFSENRAIQELQRAGYYSNIFRRFYLSVALVGFRFFYSSVTTIFGLYQVDMFMKLPLNGDTCINIIEISIVFIVIFGFIATVIRILSCFYIYYRVERIIRELKE